MSSFDAAAKHYDDDFTNSPIGRIQRKQVLDYLEKHLPAKNLNLLEINCGTGEDALWLAKKGHRVVCTDVSASMLEIVKAKVSNAKLEKKITIQQLDLTKIESWETTEKYDIIFSNFAGLNCLNPTELQVTLAELSKLLKPNGQLILVFLGRFCAWETKYFLLKGTWKSAFRRMNKEAVFADVDGEKVATWYYSISGVKKLISYNLKLKNSKAIGTHVPPSYLNPWFRNKKWLLNIFAALDQLYGTSRIFTGLSDHYLIELEKA